FLKRVSAARAPYEVEASKRWDLKFRIIDQYEQAIKHLETTRGTWKLEGDSLAFSNVKDAERYKQYFNEVDKHAQKHADMLQALFQQSGLNKDWLEK
ncbi:MAG TPA: hypothetical protein VLE43_02195, partial [Candidatus Saccharimonadia bacterium]|nr:hypothetical protein [Candidatus Saccharimonadia bacterium]